MTERNEGRRGVGGRRRERDGRRDRKKAERERESTGESVLVGLWVCRAERGRERMQRCLMCCNMGQGQRGPTLSLLPSSLSSCNVLHSNSSLKSPLRKIQITKKNKMPWMEANRKSEPPGPAR